MAELQIKRLESELREHVSRFVNEILMKSPSAPIADKIKQNNWMAFLCGGTIRDLLLIEKDSLPRDIDIIVHYVEKEELIEAFKFFNCRVNKFGGLSVQMSDWKVDIWPLAMTWAFQNNYVKYNSSFSSFTKTTFLNIEAIAVELFSERGRKRAIYSNGFFEAVSNRMLEINLKANPAPEINIARAIYMSLKYQFSFGPGLKKYINEHIDQLDKGWLLDIYKNNYSMVNWDKDYLDAIVLKIKNGHDIIDTDFALHNTKRHKQTCLF